MIYGVIQDGEIVPLDPIPADWANGREVLIEAAGAPAIDEREEIERWFAALTGLGPARYEAGEREAVERLLLDADREAKESMRRSWCAFMTLYLLDTNHLSAALNDEPGVRGKLREVRLHGDRVGTCVPVLCELQAGLVHTARREHNQQVLRELLRQVRIWPLDLKCAERYGEIYHTLRRQGRALSQVDIMLAALALHMKAKIVTTDRDFEALSELPTESWLQR